MRLGPYMGSCNPSLPHTPPHFSALSPMSSQGPFVCLFCQTGPVTTLEHQCLYRLGSPRFEVLSARCTVFLQSRAVVPLCYVTATTPSPLVLKDTSLLF